MVDNPMSPTPRTFARASVGLEVRHTEHLDAAMHFTGHMGAVTSLCSTQLCGRSFIASGDSHGAVCIVDVITGEKHAGLTLAVSLSSCEARVMLTHPCTF
jgi:hypothetical protein